MSDSACSNQVSLFSIVSFVRSSLVLLSKYLSCCVKYSVCTPPLSMALPGLYWIVMLAILGPGFFVLGSFMMHWPGVRRAEGLVRSKVNSSSLLGLIIVEDFVYIDPYGKVLRVSFVRPLATRSMHSMPIAMIDCGLMNIGEEKFPGMIDIVG